MPNRTAFGDLWRHARRALTAVGWPTWYGTRSAARIRPIRDKLRAQWCLVTAVLVLGASWQSDPVRGTEPADAISPEEIRDVLSQGILEKETTLRETQRFCETRIARLPRFTSVEEWRRFAESLRRRILEEVVLRGVPTEWHDHEVRVEWLDWLPDTAGYRVRKLRYEALPNLWIPALLYMPEKPKGRLPAVLHVNGHTNLGKQYPPKQIRCINLAKKGVIGLNVEWVGMGQLGGAGYNHARMQQLDLCGVSALSVFFYNMQRGLDVLLSLPEVDPQRVAVTGLSGGGWQTITLSALDTRVILANPVAGYSSYQTRVYHFKDLGDSEQTPSDLASLADYTHLTALVAPRALLLTYNSKDDCCFESSYALQPLVDAALPIYRLFDREKALRTHVNHDPGTHNYERDNREAFYRFVKEFFFAGDPSFEPVEVPCDEEIKSSEDLSVPLPEHNEDFHTLAEKLAEPLPRVSVPPSVEEQRIWKDGHREIVKQCIGFKSYDVRGECLKEKQIGRYSVRYWKFALADDWTVPAIEWTPLEAPAPEAPAVLLVADRGKATMTDRVAIHLQGKKRVLVLDPFYCGEATFPSHGWLFAILVAGVGERPLGVQSSQIAAVGRWWSGIVNGAVEVEAHGPRTGLAVLLAAAVSPGWARRLQLKESLKSLKEVIGRNWTAVDYPEMFCFGLLAVTDIPLFMRVCVLDGIEVQMSD